jgi:rRNA maturation protein Rpf1
MNFVEAMELLRALSKFFPLTSRIHPRMVFYDAQKEGYMIWINEDSVKPNYLHFINEIVETRHLIIRKHEGYLVIRSL